MSAAATVPFQLHSSKQDFGKHKRYQVDDGYLEWMFIKSGLLWKEFNLKQRRQANNVHKLLTDLKFCSKKRDLQSGRHLHANAVENGNDTNMFVAAALINMYAKCGSMVDARQVFQSIEEPDVVSWTSLILGHVDNGEGQNALDFFSNMKIAGGCAPNSVTYIAAIKACTSLAADGDESKKRECLKRGKEIHSEVGHLMDHFVQSTLINMYAKCGSMVNARRVFDSIEKPDVVSWTAVILGYVENEEGRVALDFFSRMKVACTCAPDPVIYVAAIKACTSLAADGDEAGKRECFKRGRRIHLEIGCNIDQIVQSTLVNMYAKCSRMLEAQELFDSIEKPNTVSWNALILGYADNGEGKTALEFFCRMKAVPDSLTYVAAIKACTSLTEDGGEEGKRDCLQQGKLIHSKIGHHMDHFVQSALINMYTKCGSTVYAQQVFDSIEQPNVVSWNALILGYERNGEAYVALDLFSRMKTVGKCFPNSVTYIAAIKACTSVATDGDEARKQLCLSWGRGIHSQIGHHMNRVVQSTLINMYAKCGSIVDARRVFDAIKEPDVVSWSVLILGYAENGESQAALDLFSRMKTAGGCIPNSMTCVAAIKACSSIGALVIGRKIHLEITDFDAHVVTCLVDFYAKCGSMVEACEVFNSYSRIRNIATWTALLAGYGRYGDSGSVFDLFDAMHEQGFSPNAVTFVCILLCCSHAGLVEKARKYFEAMRLQYGVTPTVMHYNCMIDVFGRANQLNEAVALLQRMPCNPNAVTWMTLLGACRKWKNVEIGRLAFKSMGDLDTNAYVLMAQIYGSRGMWEEQERVLKTKRKFEEWKLPGQAYVMDELGKMVKFVAGEEDPPEVADKLQQFLKRMKERGYIDSINHNVADALCGHSERRAVVYGILKGPPAEPVRAFKNMKMCDECHRAINSFSKLCLRIIVVSDETRFHVMEDGNCSCGEY